MKAWVDDVGAERALEEARERFADSRPELFEDLRQSVQMLADGSEGQLPLVARLGTRGERVSASLLRESEYRDALAAYSRGLLGVQHIAFNHRRAEAEGDASAVSDPEGAGRRLAAAGTAFSKRLLSLQQRLQFELASEGLDGVEATETLLAHVETGLPRMAALQARAFEAAGQLMARGSNTAAERLGEQAALANQSCREAVAAAIAAWRLNIAQGARRPPEDVQSLVRSASRKAFSAALPNGKNTPIAHLADAPTESFVEIAGFVQSVSGERADSGKLIGRMVLVDPSSGATVTAAVPFVHLPHIGISAGTYCRLNGYLRESAYSLGGERGIEIDRLSLRELEASSWHLEFLGLAERWYQPWRNGINLRFSMGPHVAVTDEAASTPMGAGELIFTPFYRK
jgi:hypothetical protein